MQNTIHGRSSLYVFLNSPPLKTTRLHAPFKKGRGSNITPFTTPQKYLQRVYQQNLGIFAVGGGLQNISAIASLSQILKLVIYSYSHTKQHVHRTCMEKSSAMLWRPILIYKKKMTMIYCYSWMSTREVHMEFTTKIKKSYMYKIKVIRYICCIMNSHYLINLC